MEPDLFERLGPSEDELVEDYLENVLTPKERVAFERHFLTNEDRRWQLGFVRLMKEHGSSMVSDDTEVAHVSLAARIGQRASDGATASNISEGVGPVEARSEPAAARWASFARKAGNHRARPDGAGALAASLVVLLAGSTWSVVTERSVGRELRQLRAEHELEQGKRRVSRCDWSVYRPRLRFFRLSS